MSINPFAHSLEGVLAKTRLVREGRAFYLSQYLLNPAATLADFYHIGLVFAFICALRLLVAGAQLDRQKSSSQWSVFKAVLGRFAKPKREPKMTENLWSVSGWLVCVC